MASVAGRKKSIISSSGIQIDTPVANNTLLNKSASQSTSLYQQCSQLRTRLLRIRGFDYYFSLAASTDTRQSTDPVSHIWDLFSLGISLCYLVDLLSEDQGFSKINYSTFDPEKYNANPDRAKKRAIVLFAMQITDKISAAIPGCELFTVTDLWDRNSTDGLVKVRDIFALSVMCDLIRFQGRAYCHSNSESPPRRCLRRPSAEHTLSFIT